MTPLKVPVRTNDPPELFRVLVFGGGRPGLGALPPLASVVATALGPAGCVRLGLCARPWQDLVPTGLSGSPRRRWAAEHWPRPACSDLAPGERRLPTADGAPSASAAFDEAWLLVEQDPAVLEHRDPWGATPLHVAARRRCLPLCRILLAARASVDAANANDGWTPLHCAAAAGDAACARELLRARADPRRPDVAHRVPLELAVRCRAEAVQELLLRGMGAAEARAGGGAARPGGPGSAEACALL